MTELERLFGTFDSGLVSPSEDIIKELEGRKEELYRIACELKEQYWEEWRAINTSLPYNERGSMGINVRLRDNHVEINWLQFRYIPERKETGNTCRARSAKEGWYGNAGNRYGVNFFDLGRLNYSVGMSRYLHKFDNDQEI